MATTLHDKLATCHPKLSRGQVWCHTCGYTERVDPVKCFKHGWPKHCGETMSVDSPRERKQLVAKAKAGA